MQAIINKIIKAEATRDKYAQGSNYNPRLYDKHSARCAKLQREFWNVQMELELIPE